MAKNLSRDQKRKAQLKDKEKRSREMEIFQPYDGERYRSDYWVPVVFATERAIRDVFVESRRALTNTEVRTALICLIRHLKDGGPPGLADTEEVVPYSPDRASEAVFSRVRMAWRRQADLGEAFPASDLIGIARTLLYSIEAHGANTSSPGGYVRFIEGFLARFS